MRYIAPHKVEYYTRARWVCEADLHEHLTREACVRCEEKGDLVVWGKRGRRERRGGKSIGYEQYAQEVRAARPGGMPAQEVK